MKSDLELSDFVITSPYTMTSADIKAVSKASNDNPQKEDWEKSSLKAYKDRVRRYYRQQQNEKCVYCRMNVSTATSYFHIEHIAPKSEHPEWMYEPFKQCVACPNCNSAKNSQEVLENKEIADLPTGSSDYLIIHTHIDRYFDNIEIVDGLLYKGLTKKGEYTIKLCNLTRPELLSERARIFIQQEQEPDSYSKLLITYIHNSRWIGDMNNLLDEIKNLMKMLEGEAE